MENRSTERQMFTKRIGNTLYKVTVHFDENTINTIEDRMLHLMQNEGLSAEKNESEVA